MCSRHFGVRRRDRLGVSFIESTVSEREPENPPSFQQHADALETARKPVTPRLNNRP